jgi:hypothetical protein
MNEIKINTPGIKAQIYPWQATPEKIELYNKIATQTYSLLVAISKELNLDISNFRASFDGLYYGVDERDRNKTDFTIQIKDPSDTWKEPWTGNALIPQTVSGEGLCLWTYSGDWYNKSESEVLSQLIPVIVDKGIIKLMFRFALQVRESLTPEEIELIAPNTPILVTGGNLTEIKVENPNPIERQIYLKILPMYPEAELSPGGLKNSYVIFLFPDSKPKVMNRNTIIIYSSLGQFSVYLGDDINGRIFKHMDNMLKYVEANPVEKPINEIKVNAPQPFMFEIVDNRYDDFKFGKLYFNGKLLDNTAIYSISPMEIDSTKPHIVFELDSVKYENLIDILKSNNAIVLNQNGIKRNYNMVIDNIDNVKIVNPSESMNEIRVNKPGKPFKFVETRRDWGSLFYEGQLIDDNTFVVLSFEDNSQDFTPIGISVYKTDVIQYDLHNYVVDHPLGDELFGDDSKITAIDAKYVDISSEIEEIKVLTPMDKKRPYIDNRYVDLRSIELEDVFARDYPDFVDAYISYAEFEDGAELTSEQIEYIQEEWPELVGEIATGDYLSYGNMREIKVESPITKIPIKFNRYLTAFTNTIPSGKLYDVMHSEFPKSNVRIYKNEPDIAYLYNGSIEDLGNPSVTLDLGTLKTTLDRLDIPYEQMISSLIIPIKYVHEIN